MENLDAAKVKAEELLSSVKGALPNVVKQLELASGQLPTDQDFHFYSNFKQFKNPVKDLQNRVVSLLSQIGALKDFRSSSSSWPADSDEAYDWLVGVQDDLLERVDAFLDKSDTERKESKQKKPELLSFKAPAFQAMTSSPRDVKVARKGKDGASIRSPVPFHVRNIPRPQDKFDIVADNSNTPFMHPSRLEKIFQDEAVSSDADPGVNAQRAEPEDLTGSTHPFEVELKEMAFTEPLLETVEARKPSSLQDTPFTFVDTVHSLKGMADKLRIASEIAVDLENHHYRSYQGFVCLMQVSTRDEDFVVDTLALRSYIGSFLGDIFSDTKIRKVMHGADRDIVWLQRDFGIYVCSMFDTGQASRVLQFPSAGLAFLLEQFCGVIADKRYQLADWRIRPLPVEMMKYAREDTHYLLYVHDLLKQQLYALRTSAEFDGEDPWIQVCRRSRDICLLLYTKEIFTETSFFQLHGLYERQFRPDQLTAVAKLYAWRDQMARKEDESTGYVLPNHLLFQLATEMPDNVRQLQMIAKWPQTYAGRNAAFLVNLIREAKENPLFAPLPPRSKPGSKDSNLQDEAVEEQKADSSSAMEAGAPAIFTSEDGDKMEVALEVEVIRQEVEKVNVLKEGSHLVQTPGPAVVSRKAGSMLFGSRRSKSATVSSSVISSTITPSLEPAECSAQLATHFPSAVPPCTSGIVGNEPILAGTEIRSVDGATQSEVEVLSADQLDPPPFVGNQPSRDPTSKPDARMADVTVLAGIEINPKSVESCLSPSNTQASAHYVGLREEPLNTNKGSKHHVIATPFHPETGTHARNVPEVKLKGKTKGFGASLFGRSRHQANGGGHPVILPDQVQARLKSQAVESSISLPFKTTTTPVNLTVSSDEIRENSEEFEAQKSDFPEGHLSGHEGSSDRQDPKAVLGDVLMFENEDGDDNQMVDNTSEQGKHKTWKLPSGEKRTPAGATGGSDGKKLKGVEASGTSADQQEPSFPPSLSETHRTHRRRKRHRSGGLVLCGGGHNGATGPPNFGERTDERKKSKVDQPNSNNVIDLDPCATNGSFDYAEARKRLGVENLYVEKVEQDTSGRGRGKFKKKVSASYKNQSRGFDALRRVRVDPKPEGIPRAPRRQVFSMTGNRSTTFKK